MSNDNLYVALRHAFPADLDTVAVETADGPGAPQRYTWRDLDRASAMIANLFDSLELPAGARVAVQADKSVEALMLYLGVLRAGLVYLPLNTAYQSAWLERPDLVEIKATTVTTAGREQRRLFEFQLKLGIKGPPAPSDAASASAPGGVRKAS